MQCFHGIAHQLEDLSNNSSIFYFVGRCCLLESFSDNIPAILRAIAFSPVISLGVLLVLYILFLIIFLPLWGLSFLITQWGSIVLLVILVHLLASYIVRNMAFAGYNILAQKQISGDIMRRISLFMENLSHSTNEQSSLLILVASEKLSLAEIADCVGNIDRLWQSVQFLPNVSAYMSEAIEEVRKTESFSADEDKILSQLCKELQDFVNMFRLLVSTIRNSFHIRGSKTEPYGSLSGNSELLACATNVLKVSELLRISAIAIRPPSTSDDEAGIFQLATKLLSSINTKLTPFERLSFPYMRSILRRKFSVRIFPVRAAGGVEIDCAHFPATGPNSNGLVFLCSPNAAFYEVISQMDMGKCWVGFYTNRGYDVVMFNYRGYGRSSGYPSPETVKSDAEKVLLHVRNDLSPSFVIVHGESIGGMVACHIASHFSVDVLVCDRTFASLDAAACRLLGNWAGFSARWLALWKTNVVADYLSCKCTKIILQDPNDEIIADGASLRSGISKYILLQDSLWNIKFESARDQRSRYTRSWESWSESEAMLQQLSSLDSINEHFIANFYMACLLLSNDMDREQAIYENDPFGSPSSMSVRSRWSALLKVRAAFGQSLSDSLKRGFDGCRTWITSFALWKKNTVTGAPINDIPAAILSSRSLDAAGPSMPIHERALRFLTNSLRLLISSTAHESFCIANSVEIGKLLPLSCGHNGFLSEFELSLFATWIDIQRSGTEDKI